MQQIILILVLITPAWLSVKSADGDHSALAQPRVYRQVSLDQEQPVSVGLSSGVVEPLAVAEPPIPLSADEQVIDEQPLSPIVNMLYTTPGEALPEEEPVSTDAIGVADTHFRSAQWESAGEWYLKALEIDPNNVAAEEGLVMSAFNAGNYHYAYRLTREEFSSQPVVKQKLIAAANEEISLLLRNSRFGDAEEMIAQFPTEESGLALSRQKLQLLKNLSITQTGVEPVRGGSPGPIELRDTVPTSATSKDPEAIAFEYVDISEVSNQ